MKHYGHVGAFSVREGMSCMSCWERERTLADDPLMLSPAPGWAMTGLDMGGVFHIALCWCSCDAPGSKGMVRKSASLMRAPVVQ